MTSEPFIVRAARVTIDGEDFPPKPAPVQPSLFEPPPRDCPCCTRADGTPNGRWPDPEGRRCPNCGGSGNVQVPF